MKTKRSVLAGLLAALMVSGCSMAFRQPEIVFEGIRVASIGMNGGVVHARFEVYNPNGYALEVAAIRYDLDLGDASEDGPGWVRVASGAYEEPVRIESGDTALVEVPIQFRYADLGAALRSVLARGSVDYRVSGAVRVAEPLRRTVPYRRAGTVDIIGEN